jgi:hypothetical protein
LFVVSIDSSTAYCILLFFQVWYFDVNVSVHSELFVLVRLDNVRIEPLLSNDSVNSGRC